MQPMGFGKNAKVTIKTKKREEKNHIKSVGKNKAELRSKCLCKHVEITVVTEMCQYIRPCVLCFPLYSHGIYFLKYLYFYCISSVTLTV